MLSCNQGLVPGFGNIASHENENLLVNLYIGVRCYITKQTTYSISMDDMVWLHHAINEAIWHCSNGEPPTIQPGKYLYLVGMGRKQFDTCNNLSTFIYPNNGIRLHNSTILVLLVLVNDQLLCHLYFLAHSLSWLILDFLFLWGWLGWRRPQGWLGWTRFSATKSQPV